MQQFILKKQAKAYVSPVQFEKWAVASKLVI